MKSLTHSLTVNTGTKVACFFFGLLSMSFCLLPWLLSVNSDINDYKVYLFFSIFSLLAFALAYYVWSFVFCDYKVKIIDKSINIEYMFHHKFSPKTITHIKRFKIINLLHDSPNFYGRYKTIIAYDVNHKSHILASQQTYKNVEQLYEFLDENKQILTMSCSEDSSLRSKSLISVVSQK